MANVDGLCRDDCIVAIPLAESENVQQSFACAANGLQNDGNQSSSVGEAYLAHKDQRSGSVSSATPINSPQSPTLSLAQSKRKPSNSSSSAKSQNIFCKAKPTVESTVDEVLSRSPTIQAPLEEVRPWKTTFVQYGPLSGLFGICLAIFSIISALGVLVGSNGAAKSSWSLPPSTYLAVFTAVVRYATVQGVVIAWWREALRGSTLAQLHHSWRSGTTFRGAISAGRHLGLLGLACIASTFVAIDGPLLQKATTIVSAPIVGQSVTLNITMSPELPGKWSGGWLDEPGQYPWSLAFNDTIPTANGTASNTVHSELLTDYNSVLNWFRGKPMSTVVKECASQQCKAKIQAPAVAETCCSSQLLPVNFSQPINVTEFLSSSNAPAMPLEHLAFLTSTSLVLGEYESIDLITAFVETKDCVGMVSITYCTLLSAIGEYEVLITNDVLTVQTYQPKIVAIANNTQVHRKIDPSGVNPSTLGGVVAQMQIDYEATTYVYSVGIEHEAKANGAIAYASRFLNYDAFTEICPTYLDPREDIMQRLNTLMFSGGAWSAQWPSDKWDELDMDPDTPIHTTVEGTIQGSHEVFSTNLLWGWWRLGRSVSFSPLEIAKAFEAPMLSAYNSNSSGTDIARKVGSDRVQYGAILSSGTGTEKLAFAREGWVQVPRNGEHYDV